MANRSRAEASAAETVVLQKAGAASGRGVFRSFGWLDSRSDGEFLSGVVAWDRRLRCSWSCYVCRGVIPDVAPQSFGVPAIERSVESVLCLPALCGGQSALSLRDWVRETLDATNCTTSRARFNDFSTFSRTGSSFKMTSQAAGHVTLSHSVAGLGGLNWWPLISKVFAPDNIFGSDRRVVDHGTTRIESICQCLSKL